MVYIQVEHIHSLFAELSTLRQNGWKRPEVRYFFLSFDMVDDQNTSCTYHINQNQINLENCNICFKVKHHETCHTKTAKTNKKKLIAWSLFANCLFFFFSSRKLQRNQTHRKVVLPNPNLIRRPMHLAQNLKQQRPEMKPVVKC